MCIRDSCWAPFPIARSDIFGLRAKQTVRGDLFQAVCGPAGDPGGGKRRREQRRWELEPVQHERRVELDIGLQRTRGFMLAQQTQRTRLDSSRELVQLPITLPLEEARGRLPQYICPRFSGAIHAMSKPHQALAAVKFLAQDGLCAIGRANLEYQIQRRSRRAPV